MNYVAAPSVKCAALDAEAADTCKKLRPENRAVYCPSILPLQTKRVLLAHVSLCCGCCCGAVQKGNPEVPVEWMKDEWKKRGLKKSIQLTISGCLGPCDLSNIVSISSASQMVWLGRLREFVNYAALLQWASATREAGRTFPLPDELNKLRFDPFRGADPVPVVSTIHSGACDSDLVEVKKPEYQVQCAPRGS